jgi:hydrogenase-4 component F
VGAALVTGIALSLALGLTAGPLAELFQTAATQLGASR